jgi:hypothetical protein
VARYYYYFFVVFVIRYETTATARWTSPFIVRAFFNDTITVAVGQVFMRASCACYHTPLMGARPWAAGCKWQCYSLVLLRFTPESRHLQCTSACPLTSRANGGEQNEFVLVN